ncbi:hypothetical protein psal_cds_827 [Pandoravirus salinus]|uniref:Uncharacterized protein n=1 Tax=Pandoravirus salinus TaxID=1349410 RepID=S4VW38_9VIRU|nr:hypothetical protein psal_cds_827 [Pandoravirus salinus]AGO84864.1 hypothetical protein psal_cds_827 [Pandoravirus salinus]
MENKRTDAAIWLVDRDAAEGVRQFSWIKQWPPTHYEAADAYADALGLSRRQLDGDDDDSGINREEMYFEALNRAIDSEPRAMVVALGQAFRDRARQRAEAALDRERNAADSSLGGAYTGWPAVADCALSPYEYLIVASPLWQETMATLIAVPRPSRAAEGLAPHVLGRVYNRHYERMANKLPGDLPAPAPGLLQPALQPYALAVPALLEAAADAQSFAQWGGGGYMDDAQKAAEARTREANKSVVTRAFDPIVARLRWLDSRSQLPPEVTPLLVAKPSPYAQYVWLNECQLATALSVALGRNAAVAAAPYIGLLREGYLGRRVPGIVVDHTNEDRAKRQRTSARTRTPATLEAVVRGALARSRAPVPIEALPPALQDTLGFDVWQRTCAARAPRSNATASARNRFAPLVDVTRAWDIPPSQAQLQEPQLLCGDLAREAIQRGMERGAVLAPRATRLGAPFVTSAERRAAEAVCYDTDPARPFERADVATITEAARDALHNVLGYKPKGAYEDTVNAVVRLVSEANSLYGVSDGLDDEANPRDVATQVVLALLALRSGVALELHDLSDAAHACAAVMPTLALAP